MKVHHFQHDHRQIKGDLEALRTFAHTGIREHATEIAERLLAMSAHIKIHLASEDRTLYPAVAACGDAAVAAMGERYRAEMGGLAEAFRQFVGRWRVADRVAADPEGFRDAANRVLKALHERLHREESEFFPAVEARMEARATGTE